MVRSLCFAAASLVGRAETPRVPPPVGRPGREWDDHRAQGFLFADAPMFLARRFPVVTLVSADDKTFAGACGATGRPSGFVARF